MDTAAAFRAYRRSPSVALRNRLVEHYAEFAAMLAAIALRKFPSSIWREEIEQAALIGLLQAVERFDPDRGVLFETFAAWRVRGAIGDELRSVDHLKRGARHDDVEHELEAPKSLEEFEATDRVSALGAEDLELGRLPLLEELDQALAQLPERERMVVVLHKLEGFKMAQLAELLGVTESRVSQLYTKALQRLRAAYARAA